MRIIARKLLKYTAVELMSRLTGQFTLVFDDGEEIQTDWKETVYSRHMWDYHVTYPETPLLKRHHLQHVYKNREIKVGTHGDLISVIHWDVYDLMVKKIPGIEQLRTGNPSKAVQSAEYALRDNLSALAYRIVNNVYNFAANHLAHCVTSLDILDFVEVILHPKIQQIKAEAQSTHESANDAIRQVTEFVMKAPEMDHNRLCMATRAGLVKKAQVVQCIGPRGRVTETDSWYFSRPVMSGFAEGLRILYESLVESRSAAKSLSMSKQELQDTEYFSRKLQLMGMAVKKLHMADCGSKTYLHWKVAERDLKLIQGKYYVDELGKLQVVRRDSKHLIGQTIRMRESIHCNHFDSNGICSVCFGEMSLSVPEETNIGHMADTSMTQKSTQGVLSVKHSDSSTESASITMNDELRRFFRVSDDGNSYIFNKSAEKKVKSVILPSALCANLTDIYLVNDVRDLNVVNVIELSDIGFFVANGGIIEVESVAVKQEGRLASLSHDFLNHIKDTGYTFDERGNYVVSIEGWDYEKSILVMPLKDYNMSDHSKEMADMIEATMGDMEKRDKYVSPDAFLVQLYNMVNSKLEVNLAVLGIVTYGLMIRSAADWDYRLPKEHTRRGLGILKTLMANRSMGPMMAYQGHASVILSPWSFTKKNRPDHPFDAILMPQIVQRRYEERNFV